MGKIKITIGVRVDPEVREELLAIAKAERRKLSQLAANIFEDYLRRQARAQKRKAKPKK